MLQILIKLNHKTVFNPFSVDLGIHQQTYKFCYPLCLTSLKFYETAFNLLDLMKHNILELMNILSEFVFCQYSPWQLCAPHSY